MITQQSDGSAEEWRVIIEFPDYAVSSFGRVRRITSDPLGRRRRDGILKGTVTSKGYHQMTLWRDGSQYCAMVHRLVCITFHGPQPKAGHDVAHGDGNPMNNIKQNLRWATAIENEHDKRLHGTVAQGERQGIAKITAEDVVSIRNDARPQRRIAADYGVTQANISSLVRKKTWRHVT